jgi:hypothetical protein
MSSHRYGIKLGRAAVLIEGLGRYVSIRVSNCFGSARAYLTIAALEEVVSMCSLLLADMNRDLQAETETSKAPCPAK